MERNPMSLKEHFELLANYNKWMNVKIYDASATLSAPELICDRGAFFKSILGTLNHIAVGDTIWLQRFAEHPSCKLTLKSITEIPKPTNLDSLLFSDLAQLYEFRRWLDDLFATWVSSLKEQDLYYTLNYKNMKGTPSCRQYSSLMLHFFNHQTHHRGQVTTLLAQAGQDVGVTDLLALIPDNHHA